MFPCPPCSLSFISSAEKKKGEHTLCCWLSHFLNQDNEMGEESGNGTFGLYQGTLWMHQSLVCTDVTVFL